MTAMTAATLDLMSGGRFLLGLGLSGPQVAEGWHGQPVGPAPEANARVRQTRPSDDPARSRRLPQGRPANIPLTGDGTTGLGIPLKMMMRPLQNEIPIYLAAIGPKNVALAAEIADGWLPIFVSPERFPEVFPLDGAKEGFGRLDQGERADPHEGRGRRARVRQAPPRALRRRHGRPREELLRPTSSSATASRPRRSASRISTSTARSSRRPQPCRMRSSTRSPWSARASRSPTGSTRGASAASTTLVVQSRDPETPADDEQDSSFERPGAASHSRKRRRSS